MAFTSYTFFIFLPAVLCLYFLIPGKLRTFWLLLVSLLFYVSFTPKAVAVLLFSTLVSYAAGRMLENCREESGKKRMLLGGGVLIVLSVLLFFKYAPFSLTLPVGISYFTFQVISYMADVYKGKLHSEKNLLHYALYVSFFPKIISGPIERAEGFLAQIRSCSGWRLWEAGRVRDGLVLMIWGYFQKLVIADRLAILTGEVFGDYGSFGSVELCVAAAAFYIQLYADFAGYVNIARGTAKIMGFGLSENFNAPFFAKSIREYWARWHITLSTWLRDYVYIPLGGNRKGKLRKYGNIMLTFLISGAWHGYGWNFVLWGGMHGVYQILEYMLQPAVDGINARLHTKTESFGYKLMQTGKCWLLVCVAYIFFKVPTAMDGLRYLKRMATKWNPWVIFDGGLYTLGISEKYFHFLIFALLLLLLVDWLKYRKEKDLDQWLAQQCVWFRWGMMIGLILMVVIFGAYGPAYDAENFIYFQF